MAADATLRARHAALLARCLYAVAYPLPCIRLVVAAVTVYALTFQRLKATAAPRCHAMMFMLPP